MQDPKTTWLGALGEGMKWAKDFVPAPFNIIPAVLGPLLTGMAFYYAKDTDKPQHKEPSFHEPFK